MSKTLGKEFVMEFENGEYALRQQHTDISIAINIINSLNDLTKEEYETLIKAIGILNKYNK